MAQVLAAEPIADFAASSVVLLGDTPATNASIAAYLASGERVAAAMELAWKLGAALFALVLVAWIMGILPGAFRLF